MCLAMGVLSVQLTGLIKPSPKKPNPNQIVKEILNNPEDIYAVAALHQLRDAISNFLLAPEGAMFESGV